jgi:subtilisin family serine protease
VDHRRLVARGGGQATALDGGEGRVLRIQLPRSADRLAEAIMVPSSATVVSDLVFEVSRGAGLEDAASLSGIEPESEFAQNLLTARVETGVDALRKRFPAADGRNETIAILDTGIEFGAAGVSTFADGSPKVVGFYDLTDFGRVALRPFEGSFRDGVEIAGQLHIFAALESGARLLAIGVLSEKDLARDVLDPTGVDIDGNGEVSDVFGLALVADASERLSLWVDINRDRIFANRSEVAGGRERLQDYNTSLVHLDAREAATGRGRPLAVTLPKASELDLRSPIGVQFHSVLGGHGTSCASITSGEKYIGGQVDGMAPRSRLLSYVIDATGRDVYRASTLIQQFLKARDKGATAISVSWGFATADLASAHSFAELLDREVASRGIVLGFAAGNSGPGSGSAGSNDYIPRLGFGIGAAITETQSRNVYGWLGVKGNHIIHYSSVGPSANGRAFPDLVAPLMTMARDRRSPDSRAYVPFGGTSSATPAFVGSVAALTSVLRDQGLPVQVGVLRDALFQSARSLEKVPAVRQGMGMVDVNKAYDRYIELMDQLSDQKKVDYSLHAAVKVANPSTPPGNGFHLPEGLVANDFVPVFGVQLTPEFRDDPLFAPPEIGTFADPLKVLVHYDSGSRSPWIVVPETVLLQAEGAGLSVQVDPKVAGKVGVHAAEIRLVDQLGTIKARVPVRLALAARSHPQGFLTSVLGRLAPFEIKAQPIFLAQPRSLDFKGTVLAASGSPGSRVVASVYDSLGRRVFRTVADLGSGVSAIGAKSPELPAGHYELQVFQLTGMIAQDVDIALGVEEVPFSLVVDQNSVPPPDLRPRSQIYLRNERSLIADKVVVTIRGRSRRVPLLAGTQRSTGVSALPSEEFPAFRGQIHLGDREVHSKWSVSLMQSPIDRLMRPFQELAVAYSRADSGHPLAWDWSSVRADEKDNTTVWQDVFAAVQTEDPANDGSGGGPLTVDVEAYANIGRFEKIADASLVMGVRTYFVSPVAFEFSREARQDQDWLLPALDWSELMLGSSDGITSHSQTPVLVFGEAVVIGKGQEVAVLPIEFEIR